MCNKEIFSLKRSKKDSIMGHKMIKTGRNIQEERSLGYIMISREKYILSIHILYKVIISCKLVDSSYIVSDTSVLTLFPIN